eukprot:11969137-Alexandrium_andersonii.AAC.1
MSASLVGSEMCIRDRVGHRKAAEEPPGMPRAGGGRRGAAGVAGVSHAVSYTHLTLPTICSV